MKPRRIVVVGAALAGLRAAETLRAEGYEGELTIVGDEPHAPYDRPPLSKEILLGKSAAADIALRIDDGLDAEWLLGERAIALETETRRVVLASGEQVAFDGLVIATGTRPRRLAAVDPGRAGIHELRTLEDGLALREALLAGGRLVIVGSGFIGVEVASSARALGVEVSIVSLDPPLAVAGALASEHAMRLLSEHEVSLHLGRSVASLAGTGGETFELRLDDGTQLEGETVVSAVGVVPATEWLEGSGAQLENGIVCDARLKVMGLEDVVAAGDVARWPNPRFGGQLMRVEHWTNAAEQGRAAAISLLRGAAAPAHSSLPTFWSDHFGARVQSIGLPGIGEHQEIVDGSPQEGSFATASYRDGELVGGLAWNKPRALIGLRKRMPETVLSPAA